MLDEFRNSSESYDTVITKIVSELKHKNLKKELIEAYSLMNRNDLALLEEWDAASQEIEHE